MYRGTSDYVPWYHLLSFFQNSQSIKSIIKQKSIAEKEAQLV